MEQQTPYLITRTKQPKQERVQLALKHPEMILRALFRKSFYEFFIHFWPQISTDELVDNWHIKVLCDEAQEMIEALLRGETATDLLINVPPGTTKTSILSVALPVWIWTVDYTMDLITASYSSSLALRNADKSRDLIESEEFKRIYPEINLREGKAAKSDYQIQKKYYPANTRSDKRQGEVVMKRHWGGHRYSTSVGGTLTGIHGKVLILDDVLSADQARSPVEIQNANEWFDNTLSSRKTNKRTAVTLIIMQRLHENDLTGHLLKKWNKGKQRYRHICLPGEIRNYKEQVVPKKYMANYMEDGLLDKVRLSWNELKKMETDLGQYGYAGQVGQSPTPPEGGMFKTDRLSVIMTPPDMSDIERVVRYWDKAGTKELKGKKATLSAYTVGVKLAKLKDGRFVVLDVKRGRWSSDDREEIIHGTARADGTKVWIYHEQEPGSGGKQSAEMTTRMLAGFHVEADRPVGDKIYRADPFSVQVNSGNVLLLYGAWNDAYIEELKLFPKSTYKDQVDASSGAFAKLTSKREARSL